MGRFSGSAIFAENRVNSDLDVPVLEGYDCGAGAYLRLIGEAAINEGISFDHSMRMEFNELAATFQKEALEGQGLVTEAAAIQVVTEGVADVLSKLKGMVMKAWQKIKSLYESLKVKISAFLTRDYNKFYKKHVNAFNNNASSYKGKFKFKMPKKELNFTSLPYSSFESQAAGTLESVLAMNAEGLKSKDEEISEGKLLESLLGAAIKGSTSRGDFKKDFEAFLFEDKDSYEEVTSAMVTEINGVLGNKKIIKDLDDAQKKNNEFFKKLLGEIDKAKGKLSDDKNTSVEIKSAGFKGTSPAADRVNDTKRLNTFSKIVSVNQTANNMINGLFISLVKMHIAQCKAVFTKVVSKSKMNEQVYLDAVAESAYDDAMESLNGFEVIAAE